MDTLPLFLYTWPLDSWTVYVFYLD
jgi:hypothetical protein